MNGVAAVRTRVEKVTHRGQPAAVEEACATLFTELVWTHWDWDKARWGGDAEKAETAKQAYDHTLEEFRTKVGDVAHVYWSTRGASAVAMSVKRLRNGWFLRECDDLIRLHRVTDWVARDTTGVGDVLHECDALAIRVGEILRGPSERIAMRWILCVQEHLLGFFERSDVDRLDTKAREELVTSSRSELVKVEKYYKHAASQAGRIVYVTGMLIGVAIVGALAALVAGLLWAIGAFDGYGYDLGILFLCFGSGALGALVSVMYRLRPSGTFNLDVEVGRPLVRRLGVFRPFVGATFGLLVYAMLASGILLVQTESDKEFLYFAVAAFFAGFSERWVHVITSNAESQIAGDGEKPPAEDG